ncbi:MAG: prepilin-type N-terminal cleavage/methylation domain-containing protein [Phycisphaeraceae bacterium]|nr:prepilin-type N-terminal cleavage/methylation domain-containing protein [Phycisphaeraceae bacterium]MCW5753184.1 prepilin-type N-terminal cleavage/methylation domain-containing protein [Phycisphaeraceae bacterium]
MSASIVARRVVARAYTLIEVLVIVAILGILGAMVIPSMGEAGVLRAQSAIRTIVTDITFAQSDAMAFQRGRAVMFDVEINRYSVVQVTGPELDDVNDVMLDASRPNGEMRTDLTDQRFWGARIASADFDGQPDLIFDEMGAPVTTPGGNTPSSGGMIVIETPRESYWIAVDGFTGHVTTGRVESDDGE